MTLREMNLWVFQSQSILHVFFQLCFEPWYDWHQRFDCLPSAYANMTVCDLYDHVGASMH